jgi:hypothetical protein
VISEPWEHIFPSQIFQVLLQYSQKKSGPQGTITESPGMRYITPVIRSPGAQELPATASRDLCGTPSRKARTASHDVSKAQGLIFSFAG